MKNRYNFAAVLSAVVLICCAALILGPESQRCGRRQDHRNGQTRRRGPAHEGHRHVERPLLLQGPRQRSRPPRNSRGWRQRRTGECGSLHLRRLERQCPDINDRPGIRSKELYVYSARVGARCGPDLQSDDQRSDDPQHSPAAQPDDRQYPVEPVSAAGSCAGREELEGSGVDRSKMQHPSLDARLVCGGERALRNHRWRVATTPSTTCRPETTR